MLGKRPLPEYMEEEEQSVGKHGVRREEERREG